MRNHSFFFISLCYNGKERWDNLENKKGVTTISQYLIMQYAGAVVATISFALLLYQFLVQFNHPTNIPFFSNTLLLILFIISSALCILGYYKGKNTTSHRKIVFRKKIKKISIEEIQQKKIIKPISENDVASWKIDGMKQYFDKAKYELNVYIRDMEAELKELTQQERELYIIHDLLSKLMRELINDNISLSCVDIYLIFSKLELYHVHHEKRLYESYKVNLTKPQQYQMDLMLDQRTREIIRFLLKDRYAFLPEDLANHMGDAVRQMELSADEGNVYAQFDLANVYLSSEFYGGMEAAVFYLHRANNADHTGAGELLHELQTA